MATIVTDSSVDLPQAEAERLGIAGDVVFAGNRDQAWLASLLAEATVVVSPVTGRALVEAALAGAAIVAYDYEWQAEFLSSGENAVIVPYRDTAAMANAVVELVHDRNRARELGAKARALALNVVDPTVTREQKRRVYDVLLAAREG